MYKYFVLLFGFFLTINAYELPKVELEVSEKPQIVFFTASDMTKDETHLYLLKWKTINATKVTLTFIGEVDKSGNITITEGEYNRGSITLKAFNEKGSLVDSVTINDVNQDLVAPIKFKKEENKSHIQPYYHTPSLYNRARLPYSARPRRYY